MDSSFFDAKRSWSRYKDFLLGSYLERYIPKVANSWIAHDSKSPPVSSLNYGELNSAIDTLESVYSRYHSLIFGRKPLFSPLDSYDCRDEFKRIWPEQSQ